MEHDLESFDDSDARRQDRLELTSLGILIAKGQGNKVIKRTNQALDPLILLPLILIRPSVIDQYPNRVETKQKF